MIEVTTCGPCGANLIRWTEGEHWANTQTGTFYCSETAHHRHQRNPDAGIVQVRPDALGPMMLGLSWLGGVPLANAGYLGPPIEGRTLDRVRAEWTYPPDQGIDLWPTPMPVDEFLARFPPAPAYSQCCLCGAALAAVYSKHHVTEPVWESVKGRPCLAGLTHRPGRVHQVSGQINYPLDEAPNGRCSGCGEQVWKRTDGVWTNRDGFLACAPPSEPARHSPDGPDTASCRWCRKNIHLVRRDAGGTTWRRNGIGIDDSQMEFDRCSMAPDDSMPHMPDPAVRATMPVNGQGLPLGNPGATIHMPGNRRYTLTPMEAVALIRELAMTDEETHRLAARLLIREMMPNGQIMPQFEDLVDALGLLDLLPKRLEPRLSTDADTAQLWSGNLMVSEMTADEILTHVTDLLGILGQIKAAE